METCPLVSVGLDSDSVLIFWCPLCGRLQTDSPPRLHIPQEADHLRECVPTKE